MGLPYLVVIRIILILTYNGNHLEISKLIFPWFRFRVWNLDIYYCFLFCTLLLTVKLPINCLVVLRGGGKRRSRWFGHSSNHRTLGNTSLHTAQLHSRRADEIGWACEYSHVRKWRCQHWHLHGEGLFPTVFFLLHFISFLFFHIISLDIQKQIQFPHLYPPTLQSTTRWLNFISSILFKISITVLIFWDLKGEHV